MVGADGTIRVAGLGSVPTPYDTPNSPTKTNDMIAFGIVAWEVCIGSHSRGVLFSGSKQTFTGKRPFIGMTEIAVARLILSGARPPRPGHHQISDRVWGIIERCWQSVPSKRMLAGEAVSLLEVVGSSGA